MTVFSRIFAEPKSARRFDPSRPVNLLVELDSFDKGGLQKVVHDTAVHLNPEYFRVIVVSVNGGGYWAEKARSAGVTVYQLAGAEDMETYRSIVVREQVDLSCSHFSRTGYPLFRRLGIPNVTFIHNVYAFLPGSVVRIFRKDDRLVDKYISVSRKATEYAVRKLGIRAEKIYTVPNGLIVPEPERDARMSYPDRGGQSVSRQMFGVGENDYLFLNVASYNLHKGHYLMADAMARICELRDDIKLICIGNVVVHRHFDELQEYLRSRHIENVMLMPGYFENVDAFFRMADAFLLPSFIEGWSMAMNEAMLHGKPMILTDTGGAAEVIENNDIGILIPNEYGEVTALYSELLDALAYHPKEYRITAMLADAMCQFADNREHWRQAGARGREKLIQRYDFDSTVRTYERIFLSLL